MGWTSTADPLSNAVMYFDSAEEAMRFAQRQGWPFEVRFSLCIVLCACSDVCVCIDLIRPDVGPM